MLQRLLQAMRPPDDAVDEEAARGALAAPVKNAETDDHSDDREAMYRALVEQQAALRERSRKLQQRIVEGNKKHNFYNM